METNYNRTVRQIALYDLRKNYSEEKINGNATEHWKYLEKLLNSSSTTKLNKILGLNKINYYTKNINTYGIQTNSSTMAMERMEQFNEIIY